MARKTKANLDLSSDAGNALTAAAKANDKAGVDLPIEAGAENFPAHTTRSQREELGKTLQHLCLLRGWTQAELARRSDVSKQLVSSYWTGRSWPSPLNAGKIAKALGVKRSELVPGQVIDGLGGVEAKLAMRDVPNEPGKTFIEVAAILPTPTAIEVYTLVSKNAADRK